MESRMDDITLALLSGPPKRTQGSMFSVIFTVTLVLFVAAGLYLKTIKPLPVQFDEKRVTQIKTQFVVTEKKKPLPPKPKAPAAKEVVDLTKAPLLNQKQDFTAPQDNAVPAKQAPRPVYGLRRVYSTGFGAGGSVSDAVIGKIGNTLNKDVDTVTATKQDLAGPLVSISTVSSAPRLKNESAIKPEYTKEMIEAKVEGIVRAELLVGGDGKVKEVKLLNDLGYGTRERARDIFFRFEFDPAMRDGKPVATWITCSIRYVLLQE
jgi:hypothetical protein